MTTQSRASQSAASQPDASRSGASFLTTWFAILDSDEPTRILDLISDDFTFAILFSTGGDGATDFARRPARAGGLPGAAGKGTRTHHLLAASTVGQDELFLGEVRRAGELEADLRGRRRLTGDGPAGAAAHRPLALRPVHLRAPPEKCEERRCTTSCCWPPGRRLDP